MCQFIPLKYYMKFNIEDYEEGDINELLFKYFEYVKNNIINSRIKETTKKRYLSKVKNTSLIRFIEVLIKKVEIEIDLGSLTFYGQLFNDLFSSLTQDRFIQTASIYQERIEYLCNL